MVKHPAIIAALALASPAYAQTATVDPEQVMTLLKDAGYPAEHAGDQNGYRQILSEADDFGFSVDLWDCTAGKACETILFFTVFKKEDDTPTKEALAAYTSQQPGGRMYLDRRGSPAIELELDIPEGGLTAAQFADNLKTWEAMVVSFADFLAGRPAPAAATPAAATEAELPAAPAPAAETADAT